MTDLIRKILRDEYDINELQSLIADKGGYIRTQAIMAVGRWLYRHPDFVPNDEFVDSLIEAGIDTDHRADIPLPLHYITPRYIALGVLSDIKTPKAIAALNQVTERLSSLQRQHLQNFLKDRIGDELFTGKEQPDEMK